MRRPICPTFGARDPTRTHPHMYEWVYLDWTSWLPSTRTHLRARSLFTFTHCTKVQNNWQSKLTHLAKILVGFGWYHWFFCLLFDFRALFACVWVRISSSRAIKRSYQSRSDLVVQNMFRKSWLLNGRFFHDFRIGSTETWRFGGGEKLRDDRYAGFR